MAFKRPAALPVVQSKVITPTKEQVDNANEVVAGNNVKIVAGAGTGKAQPLDELVLTPNGYTVMKDVIVGDLLVSDEGTAIKVLEVYEHKDLDMYRLTFSDGSQVDSCKDHLWEVKELNWKTGVRRKETQVRTLWELLPRIQKEKKVKKPYPYSVRLPKPIEFTTKEYTIHPYLMGYTLGNGSSALAALKVAVADTDYNEIMSYVGEEHILSEYQNKSSNVRYFNLSIYYRKAYEACGLYQVKSLEKFIPKEYLLGSVDQRIELLRGLMDSDGTCVSNKCRFSSSSLLLMEDVIQLVRSLGGAASMSINYRFDKGDNANTEYNLSIRVPFNPFNLQRKAKGYTILPTDLEGDKRIVAAKYIGKQDGKCVLVDSPNQLYITRDYTITHNSSSYRYTATRVPDKNILVLCFNAANAAESNAHPDRPSNIYYATTHSIAYANIIDAKFRKKLSYLDYKDLNEFASLIKPLTVGQKDEYKTILKLNRSILDAIMYFCRSDKQYIGAYALDYFSYLFGPGEIEGDFDKLVLGENSIHLLASIVDNYWENLIDPNHPAKISHDVYLKLFHLKGVRIETFFDKETKSAIPVDILGLDEAQDTNPVVQSIFEAQSHLQRVLVGDPMQQLYAWRGAGDAMNCFKDFSVGYLTESFRFNSDIARKANIILERAGSDMELVGSGKQTSIVTKAHLCRTNASVVEAIFRYLNTDEKVYTSINMKEVFGKLYHMQACFFNGKPMYPVKEFAGIIDRETLLAAIEYSEDLRRLDKLRAVITRGSTLAEVRKAFDKVIVSDPADATIVITTGHASKGMEYDSVTIDEDLIPSTEDTSHSQIQERLFSDHALTCLFYVMVTRAKVEVIVPSYLEDLF